jgi:ABC-type phosphate transport system substrate-binding protein
MRTVRRTLVPALAGAALLLGAWRPGGAARAEARVEADGFVVIAHASNPATSIGKGDLARIYLRKARAWPGARLRASPVDQRDASAARKAFVDRVLGKDVAAMTAYWQSQVFTGGGAPPPVKGSDADVVAHVAGAPGGVGYVSTHAALPATVKVIRVQE